MPIPQLLWRLPAACAQLPPSLENCPWLSGSCHAWEIRCSFLELVWEFCQGSTVTQMHLTEEWSSSMGDGRPLQLSMQLQEGHIRSGEEGDTSLGSQLSSTLVTNGMTDIAARGLSRPMLALGQLTVHNKWLTDLGGKKGSQPLLYGGTNSLVQFMPYSGFRLRPDSSWITSQGWYQVSFLLTALDMVDHSLLFEILPLLDLQETSIITFLWLLCLLYWFLFILGESWAQIAVLPFFIYFMISSSPEAFSLVF